MDDHIAALVRARVRSEHALIEECCERSLVDPDGRGVLIREYTDTITVQLSDTVPWGTIHRHIMGVPWLR